ncbi:MAG: CHASE2 domain-containing protein [Cyanobacteria bacterium J06635_1]
MISHPQLITLRFDGDLDQQGFRVTLDILHPGGSLPEHKTGQLPPSPALARALEQWQDTYRTLVNNTRLTPHRVKLGGSFKACQQSGDAVTQQLLTWLRSAQFRDVDLHLRETLSPQDAIQVIIRTQDPRLSALPWHQWDFIDRYSQTEIVFGSLDAQRIPPAPAPPKRKVKILAILGNTQGIDVEQDRQFLKTVDGAAVKFLVEPQRQEISRALWDQSWDILFFAGHSFTNKTFTDKPSTGEAATGEAATEQRTEGQGQIQINPHDSLPLEDLKYGLRKAISKGLQLAIFNSCDGIGLAQALSDLHIPQVIVMRQPVPDPVAQTFLKSFLQGFSSGHPLHVAIRDAREQLEALENRFPYASWLPVLFQSSAAPPPTWQTLRQGTLSPNSQGTSIRPTARMALLRGTAIAGLAILARLTGLLFPLELGAYDTLLRLQPAPGWDERILLVTITEADVNAQPADSLRGASLSDATLEALLTQLQAYGPRAIALDLYRNYAVGPDHSNLTRLLQSDNILTPCKYSTTADDPGIAPPPEIAPARIPSVVGFSDVPIDPDDTIRRYSLSQEPYGGSACQAPYSLGLLTALHYLAPQDFSLTWTAAAQIQIGPTLFKSLDVRSRGYRQADAGGDQIMLPFRPGKAGVARKVTVQDILTNSLEPNWVKDRVILIGTVAPSFKDLYTVPHQSEKLPGVEIHANAVSHILSAVLDEQPLIWTWPQWGESLWIVGWSLAGSLLVYGQLRTHNRPVIIVLSTGTLLLLLTGTSYGLFWSGGWIPLVPAALAIATNTALALVRHPHRLPIN